MSQPELNAGLEIVSTSFEDPFAYDVWKSTYKHHTDNTIEDTLRRVAQFVASAEDTEFKQAEWEEKFFDMLSSFKCTAGGRIYSNAGTEWKGTTLMNCFVSPRTSSDLDSLQNIVTDLYNQMQTLKSEGGWGQNFSWLRPRGAFIHGIGVETPGSVKYMEMYDKASDIITSGSGKESTNTRAKGKIRKGAMMGVLDVWHPDIIEFITAKQKQGRLSKFNISVNCTDEFMQAVQNDEDWKLRFPDTTCDSYEAHWDGDIHRWEAKGFPTVIYRTISALWLWNLIMESTYNRAEPGVLFLDRANYFNPLNYKETIYATNPCGEQTLAPGGVCNLGSLNLTQFVNKDRDGFDLEKVAKYTRRLVRFLDNINSLSKAPLPEYTDSMRNKRRIGCGILGWGSSLFMMKVPFGSPQADVLRTDVMGTIARTAYEASIDLAVEKGMFSYCEPEKHAENPFIVGLRLSPDYTALLKSQGIRNSSLLSIQPTGNTSILANVVSGGLEPIFMPEYVRTVIVKAVPKDMEDITPKWYEGEWHETELFKFIKEGDEELLRGVKDGTVYKIDKNRGLTREVLCEDYGVRYLKARGEWDPDADWAVTTVDLEVKDHVNDLKGFAKWVDSAMSKTVNVPHEYPFEDFKDIYIDAYKSGYVKGVTTYRAGTMTAVLAAKDEVNAEAIDEEIILDDYKVPNQSPATINTIRADGKKWYLTVIQNESQTRPLALFVHTNHPEKNVTTHDATELLLQMARDKGIPEKWVQDTEDKLVRDNNATRIARAISMCLRHGVLIKNIVATLDQVDDVFVGTFLFQVKKFLMTFLKEGERVQNGDCPECGTNNFVFSEGCIKCGDCGYSKCG